LTSLNARFVETTKKVGMHADGMGLYLKVKESGKKSWSPYQADVSRIIEAWFPL